MPSVLNVSSREISRQAAILLLALATISLSVGPASARQKKPGVNQTTCGCTCITPGFIEPVNYTVSGSCGRLNNKTCNVEDSDGNIRSGRLAGCTRASDQPLVILRRKG
jgi:hypothetical protein